MKIALLGVLGLALVAQASSTAPGIGPFENMGQVWLALIVTAGQVWQHVAQSRREIRQRQWLVEDREYVARTAQSLREELLYEQGETRRQLDENTGISRVAATTAEKAYDAANNINMKLVAIGEARQNKDKAAAAGQKRRAGDEP